MRYTFSRKTLDSQGVSHIADEEVKGNIEVMIINHSAAEPMRTSEKVAYLHKYGFLVCHDGTIECR